jgi:hypothetical protein
MTDFLQTVFKFYRNYLTQHRQVILIRSHMDQQQNPHKLKIFFSNARPFFVLDYVRYYYSTGFDNPLAGFSLLILEVSRSHKMPHHSRYDSSGRVISPSHRPLPDKHTTLTTDKHPCPRRDSNPQSQQASGCRPTP